MEGRRKELVLAALFFLVGALATTLAPIYSVLIIGRVTYGVGVGLVRRLIIFIWCLASETLFLSRGMLCYFLGNACGSNVHCRDCSKSDTWAAGISKGVLHSPWDGCKFLKLL